MNLQQLSHPDLILPGYLMNLWELKCDAQNVCSR